MTRKHMRKGGSLPGGFTLVEILVVLAIIAVLAGVLIPAVANQVAKSESARAAADVENLRTGIEAFYMDVKRYPRDIDDLITNPTGETDLFGGAYPAGLVAKWAGPYIDLVIADGDSVETGYGGYILDNFARDSVAAGGPYYVAIHVRAVAQADFLKLDAIVDGDTSSTKGRLRWIAGDTVKFFAMPIN